MLKYAVVGLLAFGAGYVAKNTAVGRRHFQNTTMTYEHPEVMFMKDYIQHVNQNPRLTFNECAILVRDRLGETHLFMPTKETGFEDMIFTRSDNKERMVFPANAILEKVVSSEEDSLRWSKFFKE